jgi:methionine biosynthesis protein MetW
MEIPDGEIETGSSREYTRINLAADARRTGRLTFALDLLPFRSGRVLDVGCGPGVQFAGGAPGFQFTGIDIAAESLVQARNHGYETIQHDLNHPLPFADGEFDVAVATDILEHMTEPLRLLQEIKRVVKPQGRLILSVPNHFFLANRLRILRGAGLILPWGNHQAYQDWNYFHLRFFRWRSFCHLLQAAGLTIETDLASRFDAPLPRILLWPGLRQLAGLVRRHTRARWRDLWSLHFLVICRRTPVAE